MTAFYAQLDTVDFAEHEDRSLVASRSAAATAAVALDMLLRDETPVLSQTQVFDHPLLLAEVAAHPRGDGPLIALIKSSRIQCRIYPRGLIPRQTEGETFSVRNAFISQLQAENEFVFAAWPELNGDPGLREALGAGLSGKRRLDIDPVLWDRIAALEMLDDAFRESAAHERAIIASGPTLSTRIANHMSSPGIPRAVSETYFDLMRWEEDTKPGHGLDRRSGWDKLLHQYFEERGVPLSNSRRLIEDVVQARYNEIVAESLGQRVVVDDKRHEAPEVLEAGGLVGEYQHMATALVPHSGETKSVLSWQVVKRLLLDYDTAGLSVAERVDHLFNTKVVEMVDELPLVRLARFVPTFYSSAATGATTSAFTALVTANPWVGLLTGAIASGATRTIPDGRVPGVAQVSNWAERYAGIRGDSIRSSLLSRHRR